MEGVRYGLCMVGLYLKGWLILGGDVKGSPTVSKAPNVKASKIQKTKGMVNIQGYGPALDGCTDNKCVSLGVLLPSGDGGLMRPTVTTLPSELLPTWASLSIYAVPKKNVPHHCQHISFTCLST